MLEILLVKIVKGATLDEALEMVARDYNLSALGVVELRGRYAKINTEHQWTR